MTTPPQPLPSAWSLLVHGPGAAWLQSLDQLRRLHGKRLDTLGLGPDESPHRVVYERPGVRLRRYGTQEERGPTVLLVPAPIKRPYVWDLAPRRSVVQRLLDADAKVFLLDWQETDADLGLFAYADAMIGDCVAATGARRVILVGHSLGGILAVLYATLHPDRLRGLVLLGAPLGFAGDAGVFAPIVGAGLSGALPDPVPGSLLGAASHAAQPRAFGLERRVDALLSMATVDSWRNHLRIERWTLDEFPLPRRFVLELANDLIRPNAYLRGTLRAGERTLSPGALVTPLLTVIDPGCRVAPPDTVLPFHQAAGSRDKTLLQYDGDVGVALRHLGPLVGRNAHGRLWPAIVQWLGER